jgi:hypothetical protein
MLACIDYRSLSLAFYRMRVLPELGRTVCAAIHLGGLGKQR